MLKLLRKPNVDLYFDDSLYSGIRSLLKKTRGLPCFSIETTSISWSAMIVNTVKPFQSEHLRTVNGFFHSRWCSYSRGFAVSYLKRVEKTKYRHDPIANKS